MIEITALILIGLVAGFTGGLLGIGGGFIIVPALIFLKGLAPHKAIGISLAVIVPTAISGALKHYSLGNIDLRIALLIALGSIVGGYVGATTTGMVSEETLKKIFGIFTIFIGCNMLFGWTSNAGNSEIKKDNTLFSATSTDVSSDIGGIK